MRGRLVVGADGNLCTGGIADSRGNVNSHHAADRNGGAYGDECAEAGRDRRWSDGRDHGPWD
jgi:hypothetical protein